MILKLLALLVCIVSTVVSALILTIFATVTIKRRRSLQFQSPPLIAPLNIAPLHIAPLHIAPPLIAPPLIAPPRVASPEKQITLRKELPISAVRECMTDSGDNLQCERHDESERKNYGELSRPHDPDDWGPVIFSTELPDSAELIEETEEPFSSPSPAADFHVVSYNIRCDKDASPFSWAERAIHVIEALKAMDCAVVCLQEARQAYARDICEAMGPVWRMSGVPRRKDDEGTQILYDSTVFTFLESDTYVFHDEGIRLCPPTLHCNSESMLGKRRCAHVRIFTSCRLLHAASGTRLMIINTHFPLEEHEQAICARQLATFIESLKETTILCGDFNSHYAPQEKGTPIGILLSAEGLIDVHCGEDFSTYHEGFDGVAFDAAKFPAHRLDYILARLPHDGHIRLMSANVHRPRYVKDGNIFRPSDHEIISATFSLAQHLHFNSVLLQQHQ